jgi:hypothetical protein
VPLRERHRAFVSTVSHLTFVAGLTPSDKAEVLTRSWVLATYVDAAGTETPHVETDPELPVGAARLILRRTASTKGFLDVGGPPD